MKHKVLVTGGCGYIGSHTIVDLINNDFEVISIDNNSNADFSAMEGIKRLTGVDVQNYAVDLCFSDALRRVFEQHPNIVGVIHFAALKSVNESTLQPLFYFQNNLISLLNLLKCMELYKISNLIFSSSCSVYGNSKALPVTENTPFEEAESPYARTKQMGEKIIEDYCKFNLSLNATLLRYFNPAGAHPSAIIGESSRNVATNLVPVITETGIGKRNSMTVFGYDYPTRDGSCVRDYIHVMDIADAHTKALQYLIQQTNTNLCEIFNLGTGNGITVLEAIKTFEAVSGKALNYQLGERREGDVISIYANNDKAARLLGWKTQYTLEDIMQTAWAWEQIRTSTV